MWYLNAAPCFIGGAYAEQMSVHPPLISSERERKCLSGVSLRDISLNCCYLSLWNIDSAGGKDWQLHESLLAGLLAEAKRFDIQTLTIGRAPGRLLPSQTRDNYPSENHCAWGITHTHAHTHSTRAQGPGARERHTLWYLNRWARLIIGKLAENTILALKYFWRINSNTSVNSIHVIHYKFVLNVFIFPYFCILLTIHFKA